jgi:hypothetical protein
MRSICQGIGSNPRVLPLECNYFQLTTPKQTISGKTHERELTGTRAFGLGSYDSRINGRGRMEAFMRNATLALLAASALAMASAAPAEAVGSRYPFCIQGNDFPGLSNCTFTSYEQCQASASGRFLYCVANPYYNPGADLRGYRGPRVRSVYPSYY